MKPYYSDCGIELYHGDCREVLPTLPEVDVVISDPPYAVETHEGARTGGEGEEVLINFAPVTADRLRLDVETMKFRRWFIATMDWHHIADFEKSPPMGTRFVRFGIWIKPNGSPQFTGDRPAMGWEGVCILHKSGGKMRWNGGGHHAVFTFNKENTLHPTGKPLPLVQRFIHLFSEEGETILDPFAGIGTTLEAAKLMGRKAIGIELNERYCEIAAKRLAQGVLFGARGGGAA